MLAFLIPDVLNFTKYMNLNKIFELIVNTYSEMMSCKTSLATPTLSYA